MDQKPRRPGLLERVSSALELPADLLAGLPRVELIGDRELRMENHKGILAYGTEEVHVSGGPFVVKIMGEGPELRAMTGMELLVTGRIRSVILE
ncbi:MAG: sporulation protein [Clostridium sp.]|nr:sporulation protein [Clostridium sp.]